MAKRFGVSGRIGCAFAVAMLSFAAARPVSAQLAQPANPRADTLPAAPQPAPAQSQTDSVPAKSAPSLTPPTQTAEQHRFWDRENDLLFVGVGAGRALDYASTLNLRRRGLDEALLTNAIVDNHALFAGIEVAGTAASIGVSYIFHRTGHHQLERWTSIVHIGVATGGAIRNYALPTPH